MHITKGTHIPANNIRMGAPRAEIIEIVGWGLAALLIAASVAARRPTPLSDDSFQYLSAARNIKLGRGSSTSLVYYDSERSEGRIPAPLTHFPPGYPALIALANTIAGGPESDARAISVLSYGLVAAWLAWALLLMGASAWVRWAVLAVYVADAAVLHYASAALSEMTFMALAAGAAVPLISIESGGAGGARVRRRALLAYGAAGLTCWVRYAGYFVVAGLVGYAFLGTRRSPRKMAHRTAAALALLGPSLLAARNALVGGDWRGGNQLQVLNPPRQVAIAYLKAQFHLLVGEHAATFGAPEALFLTGLFALALLGYLAARHRARPGTSRDALSEPLNALPAVACVILAYTGGILYASLRATDLDLRLFVPILPFYLALAGIFLVKLEAAWPTGSAQRYGVYAALLLMAAGFAGTNLRDFRTLTPVDHRAQLAALYAKPDSQPLIKWIETYLPPEQTIAAVDGQATGYLLHRPTLALVPAEHSAQRWECESLKAEMKRFGAQYLILYWLPPGIEPDPVMDQSLFLRTAAHERPTCGFSIAQANDHVRILKLASGQ